MSSWTAASSDCSRPVNNYVHIKTVDLYRPNARLIQERQGYQVLTPFGKLGYSRKIRFGEQETLGLDNSIHRFTGHKDHEIDLACIDMRGIQTKQFDIPTIAPGFLEKLDVDRIGVGSDVLYSGFPNEMKDQKWTGIDEKGFYCVNTCDGLPEQRTYSHRWHRTAWK